MAVEIEAKMKLEDQTAMVRVLRDIGATELGRYLETNSFFDTPDRALLARDEGLRLRVQRHIETDEETYILTHKGPNQPGLLKIRQETELEVDDPLRAEQLLARLGFIRWLRFQKRRWSWALDECAVELDELPVFGQFIEIEGPGERQVMQLRQRLGLQDRALVKRGYARMMGEYAQACGGTDILFDASPEPNAPRGL